LLIWKAFSAWVDFALPESQDNRRVWFCSAQSIFLSTGIENLHSPVKWFCSKVLEIVSQYPSCLEIVYCSKGKIFWILHWFHLKSIQMICGGIINSTNKNGQMSAYDIDWFVLGTKVWFLLKQNLNAKRQFTWKTFSK
jgi:hypothetical protein